MHLKSLLELDRFTSIGVLYLLKDQGTLSVFKNIRDELLLMIIKIIFVMPIVEISFTGSSDMMPKGIGTHGYRLTTFLFILRLGHVNAPFCFLFLPPTIFLPFLLFLIFRSPHCQGWINDVFASSSPYLGKRRVEICIQVSILIQPHGNGGTPN